MKIFPLGQYWAIANSLDKPSEYGTMFYAEHKDAMPDGKTVVNFPGKYITQF